MTVAATAAERRPSVIQRVLFSNELGLVVLIVIASAIFGSVLPGFASPFSMFTIGRQIGIDTMIGLAMMAVIVTGGLDLSVGAIGVCAAMAFGWLAERLGLPLVIALPGAILFGAMLGWVNGFAVVRSGVHSFIITLASMSIFFGVMVFLTRAEAYRGLSPEVAAFGRLKFGRVSSLLLVSLATCAALAVLYHYTTLGRRMLAAGANRRAAEVSGVRAGRIFVACHMLTGALAAAAGLMVTARVGAAVPSMAGQLGQDWLLPAFLAPVLGGTLLSGGRVAVVGTLLGAAFADIITAGLLQLRVGEFWIQAFLGLMLLAAVLADRGRHVLLRRRGLV